MILATAVDGPCMVASRAMSSPLRAIARRWLVAAVALSAAACLPPFMEPPRPSREVERAARAAWLGLPATKSACPQHFDFFPKGGLLNFYCHAQTVLGVEQLEQLAGMPTTVAPPADAPQRSVARAFRNYDPRFVAWLRHALLLARYDRRFREETQPIYDAWVAPLARKWLGTRRLMLARRTWLDAEVRWTRSALERGTLPEGYYWARYDRFALPAPSDDGTFRALDATSRDGNVGTSAVAFWIRRELDGSATAFTAALEELVSIYDASWLGGGAGVVQVAPPPDAGTARAAPEAGSEPELAAPPPPRASARPHALASPEPTPEPTPEPPAGPPPAAEELVAEGQDVRITVADFLARMGEQSPFVRARYTTLERKREFVYSLLRFELLAAEALRLGIDRGDDGVDLQEEVRTQVAAVRARGGPVPDEQLLLKKRRVQALVQRHFSTKDQPTPPDEEIAAYYEANLDEFVRPGRRLELSQAREAIALRLLRQRLQKDFDRFVAGLREAAAIRVNEQVLARIVVK